MSDAIFGAAGVAAAREKLQSIAPDLISLWWQQSFRQMKRAPCDLGPVDL